MDDYDLKTRTRKRAQAVWVDYETLKSRGMDNFLQAQENLINSMGIPFIEAPILIVDDTIRIKEDQLDKLIERDRYQITQNKTIVDAQAETQRAIMALISSTNNYIKLTEHYIIDIQDQLMDARVYALDLIEGNKMQVLEEARRDLAEDRAEVDSKILDARIKQEEVAKEMVKLEVKRAELNVIRAEIRKVQAELDEKRAEIREINAKLEKTMTAVDKARIQADVALIWADIVRRKLAETEYDIESKELTAAFTRVSNRLTAVLNTLESQIDEQEFKELTEIKMLPYINELLVAQKDELAVDKEFEEMRERLFNWEKIEIGRTQTLEENWRDDYVNERIASMEIASDAEQQLNAQRATSSALLDIASRWAAKNYIRLEKDIVDTISHRIRTGALTTGYGELNP